jgi:hypothetical protein
VKTKKNGEEYTSYHARIDFHLVLHFFEDMELFGAPIFYSTEAYENKIKHLKYSTKISNGHNPSRDIPRIELTRCIKVLWKKNLEEMQTLERIPKLFWRRNKVNDPLLSISDPCYHFWNSYVDGNGKKLKAGDYGSTIHQEIFRVVSIWGHDSTSIEDAFLKVQVFSVPCPDEDIPIWNTIVEYQEHKLIPLHQFSHKVKVWNKLGNVYFLDWRFQKI